MQVEKQIKQIALLAEYARSHVNAFARKELAKSELFEPLMRVSIIYPDISLDGKCIEYSQAVALYKRIGDRIVYVTTIEHEHHKSIDYTWYELKGDLDTCDSIIALKKRYRGMLKNPEQYISISYA